MSAGMSTVAKFKILALHKLFTFVDQQPPRQYARKRIPRKWIQRITNITVRNSFHAEIKRTQQYNIT